MFVTLISKRHFLLLVDGKMHGGNNLSRYNESELRPRRLIRAIRTNLSTKLKARTYGCPAGLNLELVDQRTALWVKTGASFGLCH